jgi:hypothetical protein
VEPWTLVALAIANLVVVFALLMRKPPVNEAARAELLAANERLERELRREISESSRGARTELTHTLATFQDALVKQGAEATRTQNTQIDAPAAHLQNRCRTRSLAAEPPTNRMRGASRAALRRNWPCCSRPTPPARMRKTVDENCRYAGIAGREFGGCRSPGTGAQGIGRDADPGPGRGRTRADQREEPDVR